MGDRRLALAALTAVLLCLPVLARAQSPAERAALARYRESLAAQTDTIALAHALTAASRRSAGEANPLEHIRQGLVALRLAELRPSDGARTALDHFRNATETASEWPWAWYGLGLAETVRSAWEQRNRLALGSRVGVGTLERAARGYRRALDSDPGFVPAALALAEITLDLRDTALVEPARRALRRAVDAGRPPASDLLLAWGRLERAAGSLDEARTAFGRYLEAGGGRGIGLLERARTELALGLPGAEAGYLDGAALDDTLAHAGYRADIALLASDVELARFDALRGAERGDFLRRFWEDRDRFEMRRDGERIREHYRRLLEARRRFALTVSRRFYGPADAYRSGSDELDDRGVIYVRHGEPADRLRPFVFGLMPNETWRYARAEGDLLLHFSAGYDQHGGGDLYDYRLVESVLDLRGAGEAPRDQLLLSRQSLTPLYGRMLNWGAHGAARARATERGIGSASIAVGTESDSYELQFAEVLPALANVVAIGTRGPDGLTHLVFAIPADALREGAPLRVRLVAIDRSDRPVAVVDTLLPVGRPEAERGRYFAGRVELPLPEGEWTWRAALQQGDSLGIVLPRDSLRVAPRDEGLALSDLALGLAAASARWEAAPGDTVLLTPFDLFPERSDLELYYEAVGAVPGTGYRHEVAVYRVRGAPPKADRKPVVSLSFEEPARDSLLRSHRTLRLGRLRPGRYVIEVRLSGSGTAGVTRSRAFTVLRERKAGGRER